MSLLLLVMLFCSIVNTESWHDKIYGNVNVFQEHYTLPDLPYQYDELEPYIDAKTLRVHHLGHHEAYTNKMNAILKEWRRKVSLTRSRGKSHCQKRPFGLRFICLINNLCFCYAMQNCRLSIPHISIRYKLLLKMVLDSSITNEFSCAPSIRYKKY